MKRQSTDQRRTQITAAMLRVMATEGYERATIAKIAEEAELTGGLLHYHFKSKQQILLALLDVLVARAVEALDIDESNPSVQLAAMVDTLLSDGATAQPEVVAAWVVIGAEAIRQPEVAARFQAGLAQIAQLMTTVIERGVGSGAWTIDRPVEEIIGAFLAMVHGYFTLAATARERIPRGSAAPAARALLSAMLNTEIT